MAHFARRLWSSVPPILRVLIVIECIYAAVLLALEWIFEYAWCAQICEDKGMTIWDVARENLSIYCLDLGFFVLAIGAALLARQIPVVSTLMAALPVLGAAALVALLTVPALLDPRLLESVTPAAVVPNPLLVLFFVSATVCAMVIVDSRRNGTLFRRRTISNEAQA
jgi:hypothetical protein